MRQLFLLFFFLLFCLPAEAHSNEARFRVIIDTDGAADDLRAICMLLAGSQVETLAITTSEGALTPAAATLRVKALLRHFHCEEIPVGTGRALSINPPKWRQQSEAIDWGDTLDIDVSKQPAADLIIQTIEKEEEKLVFLCLGTLTNLYDVLNVKPELKERIDKVIWYNGSAQPLKGANYDADRIAADSVLRSGILVDIVTNKAIQELAVDKHYVDMIACVDNMYAKKIAETHSNGVLKPVVESRHMNMWDDLVVVYLLTPELFRAEYVDQFVSEYSPANADAVNQLREVIIQILSEKPIR